MNSCNSGFARRSGLALVLAAWLAPGAAGAEIDLTALSVEELLSVPITTVSKKEQPWLESAAAVYVLTAEDIRRSGASTSPSFPCPT